MKRISLLVTVCSLAFAISACMPRQAIKYSLDDVATTANSQFAKTTLAIRPFVDRRQPLKSDCPGMEVSKIEREEKTFYYNCDNHYKTDSVTREMTKAITDHLDRTRLFEKVILVDTEAQNADYLLTGQVTRFDGLKEYRLGAVVAAQFGLIGALINLAVDSSFEATTSLDGLQLIRLKDNAVVWKGGVTGHIEGADPVDPYGWASYRKANLSLKEAGTKLANSLADLRDAHMQPESTAAKDDDHTVTKAAVGQSLE